MQFFTPRAGIRASYHPLKETKAMTDPGPKHRPRLAHRRPDASCDCKRGNTQKAPFLAEHQQM